MDMGEMASVGLHSECFQPMEPLAQWDQVHTSGDPLTPALQLPRVFSLGVQKWLWALAKGGVGVAERPWRHCHCPGNWGHRAR